MFGKLRFPSLLVVAVCLCAVPLAQAQSSDVGRYSHPRVTQVIDEAKRVTLAGNTHPVAQPRNDRGRVKDSIVLHHLLLQLRRSTEQEKAVEQFVDQLHNPASPDFHKWLTAIEFGERFGLSQDDLNTVTQWLKLQGFQINVVYPSGMIVDFSGTAGQVTRAFGTEIHRLDFRGKEHIGNISDPQIPIALAPVVAGVVALHDFRPHSMHTMRRATTKFTFGDINGGTYAVVPADLATIYNLNPLFSAGYSGQGQTIALIEDTDVFSVTDWSTFRTEFGLSGYTSGSFTPVHPAPTTGANNCTPPGAFAPNDAEAILDAEWASAAAPSAALVMASCADTTTTFGGLIAVQNLINSTNPPPIMSISYGQCETENGAAANAAYNAAYQQAVAEGISVFVAAGDSGAAGCDNSVTEATHGVGANAFASTAYNVAVGGTDFSDTYSGTNAVYWNSTNSSTFGSAASYIPEIPWNDSCAGALLSNYLGFSPTYGSTSLCNDPFYGPFVQTTVAGGGSPSACATGAPSTPGVVSGTCQGWSKPSWQQILGNPNDGVRDTPDVSLFAADGLWSHYYIFCWSDTAGGGAACTGDPSGWSGAGGTSFAAPILAAIQALVNQKTNARQGNPNPVYYQLANTEYGSAGSSSCNSSNGNGVASSCIFYDVTQGDMDVNCTGKSNCYNPSGPGTQGVLSTSNNSFSPAYGTTAGWDFATGIGSLNATNLVANWPTGGPVPGFSLSSSASSVTLTRSGTATSTITVVPQSGFSSAVSFSASGLPGGVTASFNPPSANNTSIVTFTASSTAAVGTTTVIITGTSNLLTSSTTIALSVNSAGSFTLTASATTLSVFQGASGTDTITVNPQNGFNAGVSLSASGLPNGVTASFNPASTAGTSTLTLTATGAAATGTFTVTITGTSGTLVSATSLTLTVVSVALPSGWQDADIGSVGPAGSATFVNGTYTVNGSGQYVWSTADGFNFAYLPWSGDVTVVARLVSMQGGFISQSTGVMIRETLTPGSANAYATFSTSSLIYFDDRPSTGANTISQNNPGAVALPYWVKLVRIGNSFSAYTSADGLNWVQIGTSQTIAMATNVFVGLAVSSDDNTRLTTATFDNVSITSPPPSFTLSASPSSVNVAQGASATNTITVNSFDGFSNSVSLSASGLPTGVTASLNPTSTAGSSTLTLAANGSASIGTFPITVTGTSGSVTNSISVSVTVQGGPLPSGWSDLDVGSVGRTGSATLVNGTYTVNGSGQYVWSTADGFNFAYLPWSGDVTVVARLVSMQGGFISQSTGVMIRETLTPGSANAYATFSTSSLIYFDDRPSTGANTVSQNNPGAVALPYWVKLVRIGNSFSGYTSADGLNWVQIGTSQTITMATNVFVGLAVSSDDNTRLTTATFDNVSIISPPPSFTLSASPSSVNVAQGASATSTITVNPLDGFNGTVSLSASGLPSGVTSSFNPGSTTSNSALTITAASTASTGTFPITVRGVSGPLASSATLSLTISAPQSFTLSASPNNRSIAQGTSGTSTITVNPQNGFNGTVNLSTFGLPTGVTASFNPTSTNSTSTLTLAASGTATTGNFTVTIIGSYGSLTNSTPITLTVTAVAINPLPSGWSNTDVGSVGVAGTASYANGTFTVSGSGAQIWGTADALQFVYQPLSGDGTIVARLLTLQGGTSLESAGLMIRETLTAGSTNVYAALGQQSLIDFDERATTAGPTAAQTSSSAVTLPVWLKLVRSGNTFSGYVSSDGVNWTQVGSNQTVTMAANVYIGLVVNSATNSAAATATFDNVSVTASVAPQLPAPWQNQDVGQVGIAGTANYANGTFTVSGSGAQVWGTADALQFVYQPLSGDGTIVARLLTLQGGTSLESAGLMIRETLTAGSTNVYAALGQQSLIDFDERATTAGPTSAQTSASAVTLPVWLKLVRSGNTFSGYVSSDGVNWTQVGSNQTVTMAANVYIGLVVNSATNSAAATATFDNVSVVP